jgi:two-component system CheB/CheR fusion protein
VGRPIGDLVLNVDYTSLVADAQDVLQTLVPKEAKMSTPEGQWYLMRMMPYRTMDNVIDGLVMTFIDITDLTQQKQAELASYEARVYAESIIETVREALVILDADLRVISANGAFYRTFQQTADGAVGKSFFHLNHGAWEQAELQRLLRDILDSDAPFEDFQFAPIFPELGAKRLLLNARRIERAPRLSPLILLAIEDRTDRP